MRALSARYLLFAKRDIGLPLDPVPRFYLGNGVLLHQIHAKADLSDKGLQQSVGVIMNYLYDPQKVSHNHERFASSHRIAASAENLSLGATADMMLSKDPKP
ncbi:malonyl-CoA decarboxylase family protein [Actibacterium sp. 188UL27-1]|nr:malonyl-CoA decarboxylase family protein [Actibacterium sp. 188UL27-1]